MSGSWRSEPEVVRSLGDGVDRNITGAWPLYMSIVLLCATVTLRPALAFWDALDDGRWTSESDPTRGCPDDPTRSRTDHRACVDGFRTHLLGLSQLGLLHRGQTRGFSPPCGSHSCPHRQRQPMSCNATMPIGFCSIVPDSSCETIPPASIDPASLAEQRGGGYFLRGIIVTVSQTCPATRSPGCRGKYPGHPLSGRDGDTPRAVDRLGSLVKRDRRRIDTDRHPARSIADPPAPAVSPTRRSDPTAPAGPGGFSRPTDPRSDRMARRRPDPTGRPGDPPDISIGPPRDETRARAGSRTLLRTRSAGFHQIRGVGNALQPPPRRSGQPLDSTPEGPPESAVRSDGRGEPGRNRPHAGPSSIAPAPARPDGPTWPPAGSDRFDGRRSP